jgi:hypothetical protein
MPVGQMAVILVTSTASLGNDIGAKINIIQRGSGKNAEGDMQTSMTS